MTGSSHADLAELRKHTRRPAGPAPASRTESIESQLLRICNGADGKQVGPHDNLFEIGASSLKLIEIHEQIDREYPGHIDLTELFDLPTVAELAQHLSGQARLSGAAAPRPPTQAGRRASDSHRPPPMRVTAEARPSRRARAGRTNQARPSPEATAQQESLAAASTTDTAHITAS